MLVNQNKATDGMAQQESSLPSKVSAALDRLVETGFILPDSGTEREDGTRARILEEAVVLFAERGYDACTMRDLGGAVGIKAPALYNHFSSKEEILYKALQFTLASFYTGVVGPLEAEDPGDALRGLVDRYIEFQLRNPDLARANETLLGSRTLDRCLPMPQRDEIVSALRAFFEVIEGLVGAVNSELDVRVASFAIVAMCDRVCAWFRPEGPLTPDEVAKETWALIDSMLKAGG
jgi:TetR/AcrR family transcriptional regulator, cholesterol catabolism regulator